MRTKSSGPIYCKAENIVGGELYYLGEKTLANGFYKI